MNKEHIMGKLEICVLALLLFGSLIYGILGRFSHTNMYAEGLDEVLVAELPDDSGFGLEVIESLKDNLEYSPYIIKCVVLEQPELIYQTMRVRIKVLKVFKGEDIKENDELWITRGSWFLGMEDDGKAFFNLGFHNIMQKGQEYLVFMEERLELSEEKYGVIYRLEDYVIAPVFQYGDSQNICLPVGEENTYVPYSEVCDNEFFCVSEEDLKQLIQLKNELMEMYP